LCNKLWNNWWMKIGMQARYQEFHGKNPFMPNDIYVQYSRYMCVMKRDLTRFLFKYVHLACYLFLAFAFCRFCKVICFFIRATTANDLRLWKIFYPRYYPLHFFPILILQKESVFPFLVSSAKQGNYWYHFNNVFGVMRSLTGYWTSPLPLGYRGGC